MPHLAESMNAMLDPAAPLVVFQPWPEAEAALVAVSSVTIAIQVMGKLRATIDVAPDSAASLVLLAAEAEPNIQRFLDGKRVVKRIHVPNRIVNFVIAE